MEVHTVDVRHRIYKDGSADSLSLCLMVCVHAVTGVRHTHKSEGGFSVYMCVCV